MFQIYSNNDSLLVFLLGKKKLLPFLLFCGFAILMPAQSNFVFVKEIQISGYKKTKRKIILRELDFAVGDSIPITELGQKIERNRLLLMNTGLFTEVKINFIDWETPSNKVVIADSHVSYEDTGYPLAGDTVFA